MSEDPLQELVQFLKPDSRIDLKHISIEHLVGVSGTEEGIKTLLKNEQLINQVIALTSDPSAEIAKHALLLLINITAYPEGAKEILKYEAENKKNILELFMGYVLDPNKKDADAACMILSNITRLEEKPEILLNTILPHLNDILNVFVNTEFNKTGSTLDYLAPMLSNLSRLAKIRKWLLEENPHMPLIKLLPFCNYEQSNIRRGGALGTIRNLTFDTEYHSILLNDNLDLLTYLLKPLMGGEEYDDEEMDMLPIALQYLPKGKQRDPDIDIRKMILETLNKLCAKTEGREKLRNSGVYYVLREYHKWETSPSVIVSCENVVDILIRKEVEIGVDDISQVEVTQEMDERFQKMDQDNINSITAD